MSLLRTFIYGSFLLAGLFAPSRSLGQDLPEGLRHDPLLILLFDKWPETLTRGPQGLPVKHLEKKNIEVEKRNAETMAQLASYPFPYAVATFADFTRGTNLPEFRFVLMNGLIEAFNNGWYSRNLVSDIVIFDVQDKRRYLLKSETGRLNYGSTLQLIASRLK